MPNDSAAVATAHLTVLQVLPQAQTQAPVWKTSCVCLPTPQLDTQLMMPQCGLVDLLAIAKKKKKISIAHTKTSNSTLIVFLPPKKAAMLTLQNLGIKKRALDDLHTHLHGMGDFDFWVNSVIRKLLPELVYSAQTGDGLGPPVEYHPRKSDEVSHANWISMPWSDQTRQDAQRLAFAKAVEAEKERLQHGHIFTCDVVYSLTTLCTAFGVDVSALKDDASRMQRLHSRVHPSYDINKCIKYYRVYNARKQEFETRYGMTNTNFIEKIASLDAQQDPARKAFLINCFTMRGDPERKGGPSRFTKIDDFCQQFTPEFYPRRYILKDDMYSQYPLVEDALLYYVLDRYYRAGVGYVELSIGIKDLIECPWMYRHLASPHLPEELRKKCKLPPLPVDVKAGNKLLVEVKFLAALNRVNAGPKLENAENRSTRVLHMNLVNDFSDSVIVDEFKDSAEHLKKIEKAFEVSRTAVSAAAAAAAAAAAGDHPLLLHNMCVGLDYVGDEWGQPHCPFALPKFTKFLKAERDRRGGRFGFRYHCGEIYLPLQDQGMSEQQLLHMAISSAVIVQILTAVGYTPAEHDLVKNRGNVHRMPAPPPLRIGHGVGFGPYLRSIPLPTKANLTWETRLDSLIKDPAEYIRRALFYMRECEIPIEVNLTSNDYLTAECQQTQLLKQLLDHDMTVVLATDDDGIWPCECEVGGKQYSSVAAEFAAAVAGTMTLPSNKLHSEEVEKIIQNYPFARFGVSVPCMC